MADIEKVKKGLKIHSTQWTCNDKDCPYEDPSDNDCCDRLTGDALSVIEELQKEIERLCKKIGVMKESIEDAIMSETVFDTFDDLSSYVNAERCRSEDWTGGIRDAIQAVRAWGE